MSDVFLPNFTMYGDPVVRFGVDFNDELEMVPDDDFTEGFFINNSEADEADVELIFRGGHTGITTMWVMGIIRWTDINNFYYCRARDLSNEFEIKKRVAGVDTLLVSTTVNFVQAVMYWFRFRAKGNELSFDHGGSGGSPVWAQKLLTSDGDLSTGKGGFGTTYGGSSNTTVCNWDDATFKKF